MTVSTILVMGPPGSRKSDFIKILAGPEKLKPNATPTDDLRSIAVSPYFADNGDIIRLVKFPGFSHRITEPTDAELLITFAVYLEGMRRRQEPISGIIYIHRIDDNGLNGPEVERNLRMLRAIAGDQQQSQALQNVVVVTTNWDSPVPTGVDRNAKQRDLPGLMNPVLNLNSDQYMQHDGSKWSALRIVDIVKGKTPRPLYIQTQLESNPDPAYTKAAAEMVGDINIFLDDKRTEDRNLRDQLRLARVSGDVNQATTLANQLTQLGVVLDRLRAEEAKLEALVDWDQALRDNAELDGKITNMRVVATKDWKAEYDRMKSEYDELVSTQLTRATPAFNGTITSHQLRATTAYAGYRTDHELYPDWLPYYAGEILTCNGVLIPTVYGNVYRVCNSSGRIGIAHASYFTFV